MAVIFFSIIRNTFGFHPPFWHRTPETVDISQEIRSSGASVVLIQVIDLFSQHRALKTLVTE